MSRLSLLSHQVSSSLVLRPMWALRFISPKSLTEPFARQALLDQSQYILGKSLPPASAPGICPQHLPPASALHLPSAPRHLPPSIAQHHRSPGPLTVLPPSPATGGQLQDRWEQRLRSRPSINLHHGFQPGVIDNRQVLLSDFGFCTL